MCMYTMYSIFRTTVDVLCFPRKKFEKHLVTKGVTWHPICNNKVLHSQ